MRFINDLAATQRRHKLLLATDPKDRELVTKAHSEFFYTISHLISDIRRHAKTESGPRRKEWHKIIESLVELSDDASFATRNDPAFRPTGIDERYAELSERIRELEGY